MAQGGNTANQLLDGIDYDMLRDEARIFAGISDGTTVAQNLYSPGQEVQDRCLVPDSSRPLRDALGITTSYSLSTGI